MIICTLICGAVLAALTVQSLLLYRLLRPSQPPRQQETETEAKSPMDEGFDNLMRYEAGGWTGFEPEQREVNW